MRNRTLLLLINICLPLLLTAQELRVLRLPNQEQLPSGKVSHVIQDGEGALWYATEGGVLCRDDGYSVEQLATDLSMSRMTFYWKIQSATGQKPTEFVRTVRLQHAAALLRQGHLTISLICYATGLASVSYFSRCFRPNTVCPRRSMPPHKHVTGTQHCLAIK